MCYLSKSCEKKKLKSLWLYPRAAAGAFFCSRTMLLYLRAAAGAFFLLKPLWLYLRAAAGAFFCLNPCGCTSVLPQAPFFLLKIALLA